MRGQQGRPTRTCNAVFIVTAWIDTNGNGQPSPGADKLEVDVSVVTPWTAQGTWTPGVAALVQANAAGASLQQLALDITGDAADAALAYPNMGPILKGELIDVTPLLTFLQQTVNNNIVEAAMNPNISASHGFGSIPPGQPWSVSTIGEAQLNSLFGAGWTDPKIVYNCAQMAQIFFARGVQMSLQPGEFDQIGQNVEDFFKYYAQNLTGTPLALLQPGNWAAFWNAPEIPATASWWSVENTIVLGGGEYFGWPLGVETEPELKVSLMNKYNEGVDAFNSTLTYFQWLVGGKSKVSLWQIPGYVASPPLNNGAFAVNVPKLAQAVFNLRTGNQ